MPPISLAGSTFDYARPSARQRWGAVLGIIVLHVAGVLLWPKRDTASVHATRSNETAITFVRLPVQLPAAAPVRPASPARRQVRKSQSVAPEPVMHVVAAPALPPEAPAPAEKSAADILLQARRDVGKIDRDLRSASLDMAQRHLTVTLTRREREIAAAFGERGPPQVVEEVMSDGRRRSRVGNKCANKESNGLVGARDVFRDGVKTRWGDC
jgi:hypothetical protein